MTLDEFQKADLRIGKVISAERVEGSDKLLKLQVDMGSPAAVGLPEGLLESIDADRAGGSRSRRQILSGIAKWYAPEDLIGKEVVIIANLEPRMMMGMESQGMLLAAHSEEGEPVVLTPAHEVPPGAKIS